MKIFKKFSLKQLLMFYLGMLLILAFYMTVTRLWNPKSVPPKRVKWKKWAWSPPKVYSELCKSCHTLTDKKFLGPGFKGLYGSKRTVVTGGKERIIIADEKYIIKSIKEHHADSVKGYRPLMVTPRELTDKEIKQLIEYFKEQANH